MQSFEAVVGPWTLNAGIPRHAYYDVKQEMGNVNLTFLETKIFILMSMMMMLINFCKGSFTCAGYPGAKLNDQIDILESQSGTWRRFYVLGFEHQMTLGPSARYQTTFQVANIDNICRCGTYLRIRRAVHRASELQA